MADIMAANCPNATVVKSPYEPIKKHIIQTGGICEWQPQT